MSKSKINEEEIQELLELQQTFAAIGATGVNFIPRMEGSEPIGHSQQTVSVDELAKSVPCVPYCGVVLAGEDLYVTYDIHGEKTQEQLREIIESTETYGKLSIQNIHFVDYDRNLGDHPDTVVIAAAAAYGHKEMSLGLAAFDSDGKLNTQEPASCACCASVIRALNKVGEYEISVSSSTPLNFPSNENYIIPSIVTQNQDLMDRYLIHMMTSLDKLQRKIALSDEKDLYVQYFARNTIKDIMRDDSLSNEEKNTEIEHLKEELTREYFSEEGNRYKKFKSDLNKFNNSVEESIRLIPSLCSTKLKGQMQKRKDRLEKQLSEIIVELRPDESLQEAIVNRNNSIQGLTQSIEILQRQITEVNEAIVNGRIVENTLLKYNNELKSLQEQLLSRQNEIKNDLGPEPRSKSERGSYNKRLNKLYKSDSRILQLNEQIRYQEIVIENYSSQNSVNLKKQQARKENLEQLETSLSEQRELQQNLQQALDDLKQYAKLVEEIRMINLFLLTKEERRHTDIEYTPTIPEHDQNISMSVRRIEKDEISHIELDTVGNYVKNYMLNSVEDQYMGIVQGTTIQLETGSYVFTNQEHNTQEILQVLEKCFGSENIQNTTHGLRVNSEIVTAKIQNQHLKRVGKSILSPEGRTYNLSESLAAINDNQALLNELKRKAVITSDIDLKSIAVREGSEENEVGSVEFMDESNHIEDHPKTVQTLIERISSGAINHNTVIAMERKQYGENLGVRDMILLAEILEHNEKNPDNQINIPEEITEKSLIYHDALLYKTAKENGVRVIGLEGKGLHSEEEKQPEGYKGSPEYNRKREEHMAERINELTSKGYNVIANIGSAHLEPLRELTRADRDRKTAQLENQKLSQEEDITRNFSKEQKQQLADTAAIFKKHDVKQHQAGRNVGHHTTIINPRHKDKSGVRGKAWS